MGRAWGLGGAPQGELDRDHRAARAACLEAFRRNNRSFRRMKFEHFALNVRDPVAHARWYCDHLGFRVARQRTDSPFTHFLADETGRVVVELYGNPNATIPDYATMHPLCFHVAVATADAAVERRRLEFAGARLFAEEPQPDGSLLIMMRDPWGVPLQLCQRTQPFPMP